MTALAGGQANRMAQAKIAADWVINSEFAAGRRLGPALSSLLPCPPHVSPPASAVRLSVRRCGVRDGVAVSAAAPGDLRAAARH